MPRHSDYTEELADEICERLANGESLVQICRDDFMPSRRTVTYWIENNAEFCAKCARARENQADFAHDEMMVIERGVLAGEIPPDAARVVISSKQWRAAKLAPKKYGDKLQTESTSTVKVEHTRKLDISTLSDEQLDALEGALRATVAQLAGPGVIDHED